MFARMSLRFKQNPLWLALILIGALGVFQARLFAGEFLFNLEQIIDTRKLAAANPYRGIECGAARTANTTRSLLSIAIALDPDDPRVNYRIGTRAWLEGDCETALAYWQASVSENTLTRQWASVALVRGLLSMRMREPAIEIARQAKMETYYYQLGYSREIAGDVPAAIDSYSFALEIHPTYTTASRLAQLYINQKDTQAERELWTRMSVLVPRGELLHQVAMARRAALNGDWDILIDSTQRAAEHTNNVNIKFDLFLRLGRALESGQQKEQARAAFEQAIAIAPTASSEPYTSLARLYAEQKDYAKASELLDRAIALFPRDPWPHIHAGNLLLLQNNLIHAEQQYRSALQIAPKHIGAARAYATLLYQHKRYLEAISLLEGSEKPEDCYIIGLLADIYRAAGETQKSERAQKASIQCR